MIDRLSQVFQLHAATISDVDATRFKKEMEKEVPVTESESKCQDPVSSR